MKNPEPSETAPGFSVLMTRGEVTLEGTAHFGRRLDDGLTFLGHFTNLLLVEGVGRSHEKGNLATVHEGSTHFV